MDARIKDPNPSRLTGSTALISRFCPQKLLNPPIELTYIYICIRELLFVLKNRYVVSTGRGWIFEFNINEIREENSNTFVSKRFEHISICNPRRSNFFILFYFFSLSLLNFSPPRERRERNLNPPLLRRFIAIVKIRRVALWTETSLWPPSAPAKDGQSSRGKDI